MSNKIIIKNGDGTPPSGSLDVAELGVDLTNKKVISDIQAAIFCSILILNQLIQA